MRAACRALAPALPGPLSAARCADAARGPRGRAGPRRSPLGGRPPGALSPAHALGRVLPSSNRLGGDHGASQLWAPTHAGGRTSVTANPTVTHAGGAGAGAGLERVRLCEAGTWAGVRSVSSEGQVVRGGGPRAAVGPSHSSQRRPVGARGPWQQCPGRDPGRVPGQSGHYLAFPFKCRHVEVMTAGVPVPLTHFGLKRC